MDTSKDSKRHFNGKAVGIEFIEYFYSTWASNPDAFWEQIIKPHSKIQCNDDTFEGIHFIAFLKNIASTGIMFNNCKSQVFDSGSRQIQILINGMITIGTEQPKYFSHFMMIVYMGEKEANKWILTNSILSIN